VEAPGVAPLGDLCESTTMLELRGVVLDARLDRCSFIARPGEVFGLVGGTGAGKSAALQVAAGRARPDRGRVLLDGRDARAPRLATQVGLAGHDIDGPEDLDVDAWLRLWAQLDGVSASAIPKGVADARERFGLPAGGRLVSDLSRGERRCLGLSRLWVRRPSVLLLDAPGEGLDGEGLRRLTSAIRQVVADGATVVIADVAPHLPTSLCDRVALMERGAVAAEVARGATDFGERVATAQGWSL